MAPEICNPEINDGKYNFQADIWSVGCTIVEMLTGDEPYADIDNDIEVIRKVGNGHPPTIPVHVTEELTEILKEMVFLKTPEERHTAATLLEEIEKLLPLEHILLCSAHRVDVETFTNLVLIRKMLLWICVMILTSDCETKKMILIWIISFIVIFGFQIVLFIRRNSVGRYYRLSRAERYLEDLDECINRFVKRKLRDLTVLYQSLRKKCRKKFYHLKKKLIDSEKIYRSMKKKFKDKSPSDVYMSNGYHKMMTLPDNDCTNNFHDCIISADSFKEHYFITFKDDPFYDQQLYDFILTVANLTVLVSVEVKYFSWFRNMFNKYAMYPFKQKKNSKLKGSGIVYEMNLFSEFKRHQIYQSCPCQKCSSKETKSYEWAEIRVITSAQLVHKALKNCKTTCRFFFDSPTQPGISVEVVGIEEMDLKSNWCVLRCVTCDMSLIRKLDAAMETFDALRVRVYDDYFCSRDDRKVGFIVSHPFGNYKHVSLGRWESKTDVDEIWSQYTYSIKTFPGSAGAYVHILGYSGEVWHYPHLHKCNNYSGPGFNPKKIYVFY